jgi:CheY-like chemotaxis protein
MSGLKRILHVEDAEDIRKIVEIVLVRMGGYEVHQCADGAAALAEGAGFAPDLILLDVVLPDMEGPEILQKLRDQPLLAAVPVIFMTGKSQREEIEDLVAVGAAGVLVKPFDPSTLCSQIAEIWNSVQG